MNNPTMITVDGNEAVASVAYRMNEVIAIYPITPSSPMGESCDEWSVQQKKNLWGVVPSIAEMQSEGGAAGAVHGSLQAGALTTTFTASQGLLLMIPNMFKIAGELNSYCMHVAARTLATHALSIFGDHSDVMSCRGTGFSMLCAGSVQEAQDFACIGQATTLKSRVPVMNFFDGFRTSHEVSKIHALSDDDLRAMIDDEDVHAHRQRALSPDHPVIRGTAQNPDTFFQAREASNPYYDAVPRQLTAMFDRFAAITGRHYKLFDYVGAPDAERVIVMMGSGSEAAHEAVDHLVATGEKVGLIKVRLYRPFAMDAFIEALPAGVKAIAVLDRTKEPGAVGEPLYQDVLTTLSEARANPASDFSAEPRVIGGRYGLSSKEFTPAMVKGVLDHLTSELPKQHFTVGIVDDVTKLSIDYDSGEEALETEVEGVYRAVFYGLGADGTVGANKNTIKIIGESTDQYVQGYFVYDSKKSGARTVSHLRFGPKPIRSTYLIDRADFVACHQSVFLDRYDMLKVARPSAVFLLNSSLAAEDVWGRMPREAQQDIIEKGLRCYVIDAEKVAKEAGLPGRINTVMQVCFFKLAEVIPPDEAIDKIKKAIVKTYQRKGDEVVRRNIAAVDQALSHLAELPVPGSVTATRERPLPVSDDAPESVRSVHAMMIADQGDLLPVSAFPPDGTWETATTQWEKRNIATEIPIWDPAVCIQCNKCAMVCPHAAIRAKVYEPDALDGAPETFLCNDYKAKDLRGNKYTIQVAPEDCTGCQLCVQVCPAKNKANPREKAINMRSHADNVDRERVNYDFFLDLPEAPREKIVRLDVKGSQLLQPLFEYSGACAGCGETPYIKLLTQLFGDRTMIANATGCSSIYGGNLPTTPYCTNSEGRGPSWSNSLFEDNAEFGFGMRLAVDQHAAQAEMLLRQLAPDLGEALPALLLDDGVSTQVDKSALRARVSQLREQLENVDRPDAKAAVAALDALADYLVPKSVWLIGGDGWAYDIGYGGLDHVMSTTKNVNILVLDTEVYSNTGGQQSKATPLGAAAKFAIAGKEIHKKDLGLMAMSYGHVYVASVAFGANDNQTVKAMLEAEAYPGPSLVIAYSHCIAHGYNLKYGIDQQKRAVESGVWPLYRFDPRRIIKGDPPLQLDSGKIKGSVREYMSNEARFRMVEKIDPQRFRRLAKAAKRQTEQRVEMYNQLAQLHLGGADTGHGQDNN